MTSHGPGVTRSIGLIACIPIEPRLQRLGRTRNSYVVARASNAQEQCSYPHTALDTAIELPAICGLSLDLRLFLTLEAEDFPGRRWDGEAGLAVLADRDALVVSVVDDL